jgi:hypothetical protein
LLACGDKIAIGGKRMHKFGKVVLSRKGFDSAAGGDYSPFDPQTGRYVVLPIPVDDEEIKIYNPLKYEEIHIKGNYLDGYPETNLKSLMKVMEKKATIKIKGEKKQSEYAHFDPWLGDCPWLAGDSNHSIGAFGQIGMPQQHLDKQKVREDSLFLFFSRFKPMKSIGQNRENIIVPDIGDENLKEGLYFIYGWLKVKKVIQQYGDIQDDNQLSRHPHATQAYFDKEDRVVRKKSNTIYIADELLFPDDTIPGCGYFPRLNKDLCLTASDQGQEKWIPSRWRLPGFLYDKCLSVMNGKGRPCNDGSGSYLVNTPRRWQEAVFDESEEEFYQWFSRLLKQVVSDL